jgi:YVTN family beta-propeller protein
MDQRSSIAYSLILTLVMALASPHLFDVEKAWADSVIKTITVGIGPYGDLFDPNNGHIYVANLFSNSVSVIDGSTNTVIATITGFPSNQQGYVPRELAFDSQNGNIYSADVYSNTVSVIDGKTNTLITSIPTGGSIVDGVAYDSLNNNIYAVNAGSGTVSVIDGTSNKVTGTIPIGSNPEEATFDPDNGYIYVANEGSSSVSVIDGSKNAVIATITGVPDPVQVVYNHSNHYLYVAGHFSNSVSIIDTTTNKLMGILNGFQDPTGVGYNSATGNIYIGNQGSNYVSILSGATNKIIGTVTVGQGPVSPAFDPNNGNMYVTDFNSNESPGNTVAVISTTTPVQPPTHTTITSAIDGNGAAVSNSGSTVSTSITFQVTATAGTNPIAGFQCSLDNSPFSSCASTTPATISYNNLAAGQHTFAVRAVDTKGNVDTKPATFSWTVLTPTQAIQNLITTINSFHLSKGVTTSLEAPLNAALAQLNRNHDTPACNQLNAFLNRVIAKQTNGQLTPQQAADLSQQARAIQQAIGCSNTSGMLGQTSPSLLPLPMP